MYRNRKNIRLRGYDYSSEGFYFITICTKNRECFFGSIQNKKFKFSPIGAIAYTYWHQIPYHFDKVQLGEFIIMPNHIHGIIKIIHPSKISDKLEKQTYKCGFSHQSFNGKKNKFKYTISGSISSIINQFKSSVTRWCNIHNFEFEWQERFHDHIIRDKH
ncbi:MAG: hypothetical protein ACOCWB_01800 [Bacteroidota bacterium]